MRPEPALTHDDVVDRLAVLDAVYRDLLADAPPADPSDPDPRPDEDDGASTEAA